MGKLPLTNTTKTAAYAAHAAKISARRAFVKRPTQRANAIVLDDKLSLTLAYQLARLCLAPRSLSRLCLFGMDIEVTQDDTE